MKSLVSLFFILSLTLTVSCGNDSKKSKSSNLSTNPYQASTFTAHYTPTKQSMIYYGNKWYNLQAFSQESQQQIAQVQQAAAQQIMQGSGQYPLAIVANIPMFRVKVVGALGGANVQQYPNQYPQQYPQQYQQYPVQQYPQQTGASDTIAVQSIQLY